MRMREKRKRHVGSMLQHKCGDGNPFKRSKDISGIQKVNTEMSEGLASTKKYKREILQIHQRMIMFYIEH